MSATISLSEAYAILGIRPGVDKETLRNAWRQKARESHPDLNGEQHAAQFKYAREAYVLVRKAETLGIVPTQVLQTQHRTMRNLIVFLVQWAVVVFCSIQAVLFCQGKSANMQATVFITLAAAYFTALLISPRVRRYTAASVDTLAFCLGN